MDIYYLTLILFINIFQKCTSLKCYECTDFFNDAACGDDFDPEGIKHVECEGTDVCMTHLLPELSFSPEITQRGCVDKYYCSNIDALSGHCITCQEDLCNSSVTIRSFAIFIISAIIIKFLL